MAEGTVYAGFWVRVGASLIDTVLLLLVTSPILVIIYGWAYYDTSEFILFHGTGDVLVSWVLPPIAIILFWIYKQATPGKMAVNARIVDVRTGGPPSTGQCIGRYFAYFISAIPFCLGFLWVAIDRRKQGWHDKLAGTVVIRNPGPEPVRFDA